MKFSPETGPSSPAAKKPAMGTLGMARLAVGGRHVEDRVAEGLERRTAAQGLDDVIFGFGDDEGFAEGAAALGDDGLYVEILAGERDADQALVEGDVVVDQDVFAGRAG